MIYLKKNYFSLIDVVVINDAMKNIEISLLHIETTNLEIK